MKRIGRWMLLIIGFAALFATIFAGITFAYYFTRQLPPPTIPISSEIYDDQGNMVTTLGSIKRFEVDINQIPTDLQHAIVAIEDHRFYEHRGVDLLGIARAVFTNFKNMTLYGPGGSTITQQMARNSYEFLGQEKKYSRKIIEAITSVKLETIYTKDEILEFYCNVIYMGHGVYGVESAAQLYFGKTVSELTLSESATIAGIIRSPGNYSPYVSLDRATTRRDIVLNRMTELGFLTEEEMIAAKAQAIVVAGNNQTGKNIDHFRNAVLEYLTNEFSDLQNSEEFNELMRSGGLKIYTTMNTMMQEAAESAVEQWDAQDTNAGLETALVAIDPQNGEIKAMVGSRDLQQSTWNRVFAERPAGSTFKPFLYAAALESQSYTAASILHSAPTQFDIQGQSPYEPSELHADTYYGAITMRTALAKSSNIAAIELNYLMSADPFRGPWSTAMIEMAHRLGIESELDPVLSLPLGVSPVTPLEMANAYATFASGGYRNNPYYIRKIEDKYGNILIENTPSRERVIGEDVAWLMTDLLKSVLAEGGTASYLAQPIGRPAAAKTGTSEGKHDGWFVGYTPDLACAVWAGSDDNSQSVASGGGTAGYTWASFINNGLIDVPKNDFVRPSQVVSATIDPTSGQLATRRCPTSYLEYFLAGTEPIETCAIHPNTLFPPFGDTDGDGISDWNFWDWINGKYQDDKPE